MNENHYLFVISFLMLVCIALFRFTYCKGKENKTYEACFVGFEFDDTSNGIPSGRGLLGFKIYSIKKEISVSYIKEIFCELFYPER